MVLQCRPGVTSSACKPKAVIHGMSHFTHKVSCKLHRRWLYQNRLSKRYTTCHSDPKRHSAPLPLDWNCTNYVAYLFAGELLFSTFLSLSRLRQSAKSSCGLLQGKRMQKLLSLFQFETALLILLRELGRLIMQATLQSLEPAPAMLPADIYLQCGGYRRR